MEVRDVPTILRDAIQILKENGELDGKSDEESKREVVAVTGGSEFVASHIV